MISFKKAKELNKAGFKFPKSLLMFYKDKQEIRVRGQECFPDATIIDCPDADDLTKLLPRGFAKINEWAELVIIKVTDRDGKDYDVAGYWTHRQLCPSADDIWFCNSKNEMSFEDVIATLILKLHEEKVILSTKKITKPKQKSKVEEPKQETYKFRHYYEYDNSEWR